MKQKNGKRTKDSQITTKGNITPYTNMEKADENSKENLGMTKPTREINFNSQQDESKYHTDDEHLFNLKQVISMNMSKAFAHKNRKRMGYNAALDYTDGSGFKSNKNRTFEVGNNHKTINKFPNFNDNVRESNVKLPSISQGKDMAIMADLDSEPVERSKSVMQRGTQVNNLYRPIADKVRNIPRVPQMHTNVISQKRIDIKDPSYWSQKQRKRESKFGIPYGLPLNEKTKQDPNLSPNERLYSQMKRDIDADKMIYDIVNKQIIDCFTFGSENSTCVSQNRLYKCHPVIKTTMTLSSFCIFLSHCPLIELEQNQVLYNENDTATAFYFILAGVVSLKSK